METAHVAYDGAAEYDDPETGSPAWREGRLLDLPEPDYARLGSGHRERLRERFLRLGGDGFTDLELLEMLLGQVILRADTKPLAAALLDRYVDLPTVLAQSPARLKLVKGVGDATAIHLALVHAALLRTLRAQAKGRTHLGSQRAVTDYLRVRLGNLGRETFVALYVDARNHLLMDETIADGTINQAPVYPREVARRALECDAASVFLAHNHPSGDPTPSKTDIATTLNIQAALSVFGIACIDHFIIAGGTFVSMRDRGDM
jgi:DNA repair protein RadC